MLLILPIFVLISVRSCLKTVGPAIAHSPALVHIRLLDHLADLPTFCTSCFLQYICQCLNWTLLISRQFWCLLDCCRHQRPIGALLSVSHSTMHWWHFSRNSCFKGSLYTQIRMIFFCLFQTGVDPPAFFLEIIRQFFSLQNYEKYHENIPKNYQKSFLSFFISHRNAVSTLHEVSAMLTE